MVTKQNQVYRCSVCGNIIETLHVGGGTLVCCGKEMELMNEKIQEAGFEKHLPVILKTEKGIKIKVGSVPHPMEEKHFIEWIELLVDGRAYREFLKPGNQPEAEFCVELEGKQFEVREYCNLHGLWKA